MKKTILTAALTLALVLSACGQRGGDPEPEQTPVPPETTVPAADTDLSDAYEGLIGQYTQALTEHWTGGDLAEAGLNYMIAEVPADTVGYAMTDLDENGVPEWIVGTRDAGEDFYRKLIFDVYTLSDLDEPILVFSSTERNRLYWAGGDCFAHIGSSGANDSFDTTDRYRDGVLEDLNQVTDSGDYRQMELTAFLPAGTGDLGPLLDEVRERVHPGTAGCSLTAAQMAVKLMNWAADSGVTETAARQVAAQWMLPLDNEEAAAFAGQMELVDTACRELTGEHGEDLLSSIGLTAADCCWGDAVPAAVDAILSAVGDNGGTMA